MGWATKKTPRRATSMKRYISLDQQAAFWRGIAAHQDNYDYVSAAFIWNLNFAIPWTQQGQPAAGKPRLGLLRRRLDPDPAFAPDGARFHWRS